MSGFPSPATRPSLFPIMASSRFAPGGRTSRRATGASRNSRPPPSTRKAFTNSATRSSRWFQRISAPVSISTAALPRISSSPGTWVSVGPLRARLIAACAPLVRDVVIAGINRDEVSALVILDLDGCRVVNPALAADDLAAAASDSLIRDAFRERLAKFLAASTGSSNRIMRAILIDTPLSIDRGEVTDKGSINQRAVLDHRGRLIEELYSPTPAAHVITL